MITSDRRDASKRIAMDIDRRAASRRYIDRMVLAGTARREDDRDFTIPIAVVAVLAAGLALIVAFTAAQSNNRSVATLAPTNATPTPVAKAADAKYDMVAKRFDPVTRPVVAGPKTFSLTMEEKNVKVGEKVYPLWTFNGTAPGPVLRAVVGDQITIKLTNAATSKMAHSVDFHSSMMSMGGGDVQVMPGKTGTFSFPANKPGVYMYHCATAPVLEHIGKGMYGMIIIQPKGGFGPKMPEYAIVQSELYQSLDDMTAQKPGNVVFNGVPSQYANEPIQVKPNGHVRVFFMNAGPSELSSFHVVGTIFDKAYEEGNPRNVSYDRQALAVPASGGAVLEMQLIGEGKFPFVTHQFNHVAQGAVGMFVTGDGDRLGNGKAPAMSH